MLICVNARNMSIYAVNKLHKWHYFTIKAVSVNDRTKPTHGETRSAHGAVNFKVLNE